MVFGRGSLLKYLLIVGKKSDMGYDITICARGVARNCTCDVGGRGAACQRRLPAHRTPHPSPSAMGGATDFKVGVQNRTRERSERKKIFVPPLFQMWEGTSKQISVGAY